MKPKLSICMMVKNEEKNLGRCLDSLEGLLMGVPSELIIVDTGSEDATVEIARKYTDKVFFHKWNSHFSEMRNKTISYAAGEWIFIIDADEELVSANNIVEFINSPLSKGFSVGGVTVKNLTLESTDFGFVLLLSPRLFRNDGYFRYEGAVHNMPVYRGNTADLNSTLLHYGYIATDKELMEKKFIRTSEILKRELEKDPNNLYYHFQLSTSYQMHDDHKEALDEAIIAYNLLKRSRVNPRSHIYIYCQLAKSYFINEKYTETEKICEEGLSYERDYLDLYFYQAQAQAVQEKYELAIKNYEKYLKLIDNYNNLKIKSDPSINIHTASVCDEAFYNLSVMYTNKGDYFKALGYVEKITSQKYKEKAFPLHVNLCFRSRSFNSLKELYISKKNGINGDELNHIILDMERQRRELQYVHHAEYSKAMAEVQDVYGDLNAIRFLYSSERYESLYERVQEFAEKYSFNELSDFYGDIFYFLISLGQDISSITLDLSENNIISYLKYLDEQFSDFFNKVMGYANNMQTRPEFQHVRIKKNLLKYLLLSPQLRSGDYEDTFLRYIEAGTEFIKQLYSTNAIVSERIYDLKNVEEAFLLYIHLASRNERDNKVTYIRFLNKAVKIYPAMSKGIEILMQKATSKHADNRMVEYSERLKASIQRLINMNEAGSALDAIHDYEGIMGTDDVDVCSMKAISLLLLGKNQEAEQTLLDSISIYPQNFDLVYNLGFLYMQTKQYKMAYHYFGNALKVSKEKGQENLAREALNGIVAQEGYGEECGCFEDNREYGLKVLHGTMEIANQMNEYSTGLKNLGIDAKTVCYYPNYFKYHSDYVLDVSKFSDINEANNQSKEMAAKFISEFDVFHFHFGTSLTLDKSDLPVLRELNKKVFMNYWGSEVRQQSKAVKINPYIKVKFQDEDTIKRNLEFLGKHIKHAIVADYELYEYVKDYHEQVHFIPQAIDLSKYMVTTDMVQNKKPLIVHAPTSSEVKGTKYILDAIEQLKPKYDFDFFLVQNMAHEEAKKVYAKADIIIDSILEGAYGIFAMECMALKKPVIGWICDALLEKYPAELPIVSANPDTVKGKLEMLLKDAEMRRGIGEQGRLYVEKYHDTNNVAKQLLQLYRSV